MGREEQQKGPSITKQGAGFGDEIEHSNIDGEYIEDELLGDEEGEEEQEEGQLQV